MQYLSSCKNIIKSAVKDDCFGMASEMAFNLILTIFPFLIAATAIFAMLGTESTVDQIILSIKSFAPPSALQVVEHTLRDTVNSSSRGVLTICFILGTVFASNAIHVLMKSLNKAYGVPETRGPWKIRALTLWIIVLFFAAIVVITNLIIMGKVIFHFFEDYLNIHQSAINTIYFIRWPTTFLMLFIVGFTIYYFIPNISSSIKNKILSSIPGTLFFTVGWLAVSRLFGFYVESFAHFNKIYGTLGAVIILLLWLYYTSLVILIGGEINSKFYRHFKAQD